MNSILKQRSLFMTKVFELTDRSLKVKVSKSLGYYEDEFTYEDISWKFTHTKKPNKISLWFCIFLFLGLIITICSHFLDPLKGSSLSDILFYSIPFAICLVVLYFTYEDNINIMLYSGRYLTLSAKSPNTIEVDTFIETLKKDQKEHLLQRYAQPDPYLSDEQMSNNLKWLWDRKIIDDRELKELRKSLLPPSGNVTLGFKFKTNEN